MKRIALVLFALGAGLAGCGWITGPDVVRTEAGFSASAGIYGLTLRNASPHPVHYVAVEEESGALIHLIPDPTRWPSVQPGQEVRIRYAQLEGYSPGEDWAVVHWWTQGTWGRLRVALR
jgi:hypothetical protein